MSKDCTAINLPFFPIGIRPNKETLLEIALQLRSEAGVQPVNKYNFIYHYPVGRGGFGRVWKVEHKRNKYFFAMKEMQKIRIVSKRSVHSVMNERKLLAKLNHSFIVNMHYAFQDRENLYLVLDYMKGGDLRYHLSRHRTLNEVQAKFFAGCIVLGLEYLHSNRIIHRDIKPENLVLDGHGYLCITDFGIARVWSEENSKDTSGTPGYMAPEVLCRQNHSFSVDYFALGVIVHEMMIGRRPYTGRDRKDIRDQILSKQIQIKPQEVPKNWSLEAADFINQLLTRKAANRLGKNPSEVRNHPWFKDFQWKDLYDKTMQAPFLPLDTDNFDPRVTGEWKDELESNLQMDLVQAMFPDYHYEESHLNPESPEFVHKKFSNRLIRLK
jgi:serine/threonine protein kinase